MINVDYIPKMITANILKKLQLLFHTRRLICMRDYDL